MLTELGWMCSKGFVRYITLRTNLLKFTASDWRVLYLRCVVIDVSMLPLVIWKQKEKTINVNSVTKISTEYNCLHGIMSMTQQGCVGYTQ